MTGQTWKRLIALGAASVVLAGSGFDFEPMDKPAVCLSTTVDQPPAGAPPTAGPGPTADAGVWVISLDGSGLRRLPRAVPYAFTPPLEIDMSWSPDWSRVAYVDETGGLVTAAADGTGEPEAVAEAPLPGQRAQQRERGSLRHIAWSPDGTRFVGLLHETTDLAVVDADGSDLQTLISDSHPHHSLYPSWSPDSTQVVINDNGTLEIVDVNTGGRLVIVDDRNRLDRAAAADPRYPTWSPDGELIAFTAGSGYYDSRIEVVHPDGTGRRRLVDDCYGQHPSWSPDGTKLAFADAYGIVVVNTDGSSAARIANSWGGTEPAWSPDGQSVAFLRR